MRYADENAPLMVLAGREYGTGSSRDWAAKGTFLLGVKAVLTESYERIHRSNLIGMGVLPLEYAAGDSASGLGLTGEEEFDILAMGHPLTAGQELQVSARGADGSVTSFTAVVRLDSPTEVEYYRQGGILQKVLRELLED